MSTSTQQPEAPTSGPKTTLTVPAKPAAITGANLLTLAGTAAVAGGPVGWLAAGAVLGAPVAVLGARRAYRNRKQQRQERRRSTQERRTTSTQGGGRRGLLGGSGTSGTGRGRAGSGTGGAAGAGRGRRGLLGGGAGTGAGGAGTGRRSGLLGRLTRGAGSAGGAGGSKAGAGGRHAAGRGSGGAGTSGRSGSGATSRRGGGGGVLPGWLRRNKNGSGSGTAGDKSRRGGGIGSTGTVRRWGPCNGIEDRHGRSGKPGSDRKPPSSQRPGGPVKPNVNRGPQQRGPGAGPPATRPVPARPGAPVRLPGQHTRTTPGGDMSAGTREAAGRMWANTAVWEPKGMLDALEEFHDLPQSLAYVRATVGTLMEKSAGRLPLDSAIAKQIGQIVALLDTAAKMAPKVPEAIEAIHKAELDRLRRPRAGESKWDRAANGLA